jgi:hypothetical protein
MRLQDGIAVRRLKIMEQELSIAAVARVRIIALSTLL